MSHLIIVAKLNTMIWLWLLASFCLLQSASALSAGENAIKDATPSQYTELYDQINDYLESNVEQTYVDYNMRAAIDWLASLKAPDSNKSLVDALELLTSLTKLKNNTKCDRDDYSILMQNYLAAGNRKLHHKLTNTKRIENMIYFYGFQHAKQCRLNYVQNHEIKYNNMDKRLVRYVETFLNPIMYSERYPIDADSDWDQVYKYFLATEVSMRGPLEAEILFKTLEKITENDSKRDHLIGLLPNMESSRRDKIREMYDKYLIKPCEYYIKQLGPDIFDPITFDDLFKDRKAQVDNIKPEFYHSWARFRFCEALVEHDQESLFSDIIKLAEGKSN